MGVGLVDRGGISPAVGRYSGAALGKFTAYMVGGRANGLADERLCRFEFPERPGALLDFLTRIGKRWNISLFHYRNHGAAYGRVLMGIQVPPADSARFDTFLDEVGFTYWKEIDNPAYKLFLG